MGRRKILLQHRDPCYRARVHQALCNQGYSVFEAVNEQHREVICERLGKIDAAIIETGGAEFRERHPHIPLIGDAAAARGEPGDSGRIEMFTKERMPAVGDLVDLVRKEMAAARTTPRALIVDPDPVLRELLKDLLESAGYRAAACGDAEVIRAFYEFQPDIVITELVMEHAEGLQLIQSLRRLDPSVKIVATTGAGNAESYLAVALLMGAHAAIGKPFEASELVEAVSRLTPVHHAGGGLDGSAPENKT